MDVKLSRYGKPVILIIFGTVLTCIIFGLVLLQLVAYSDWPPFTIRKNLEGLSLGETGDFVGGWANSVALVWLIVVTALQYIALNVQQEELRLTRSELEQTRVANEGQSKSMLLQATLTADILGLERSRSALDFILKARPLLRELLIEANLIAKMSPNRSDEEKSALHKLLADLSLQINNRLELYNIGKNQDEKQNNRLASHTLEITDLFDEAEVYCMQFPHSKIHQSFIRFREVSHLYDRCKELQSRLNLQ